MNTLEEVRRAPTLAAAQRELDVATRGLAAFQEALIAGEAPKTAYESGVEAEIAARGLRAEALRALQAELGDDAPGTPYASGIEAAIAGRGLEVEARRRD